MYELNQVRQHVYKIDKVYYIRIQRPKWKNERQIEINRCPRSPFFPFPGLALALLPRESENLIFFLIPKLIKGKCYQERILGARLKRCAHLSPC